MHLSSKQAASWCWRSISYFPINTLILAILSTNCCFTGPHPFFGPVDTYWCLPITLNVISAIRFIFFSVSVICILLFIPMHRWEHWASTRFFFLLLLLLNKLCQKQKYSCVCSLPVKSLSYSLSPIGHTSPREKKESLPSRNLHHNSDLMCWKLSSAPGIEYKSSK